MPCILRRYRTAHVLAGSVLSNGCHHHLRHRHACRHLRAMAAIGNALPWAMRSFANAAADACVRLQLPG
ncbi:hypothetical protein A7D17_20935 [Xanthomonas floridensis]|uniref:Uncharacterized protein n=1 Tax=Xanthomonas floridensis TaxID=1843580 RepID=A0A1A9MAG6_9XANT|nr:hypothetical protein A7D17_20935 [Xanthomonas floridensis]